MVGAWNVSDVSDAKPGSAEHSLDGMASEEAEVGLVEEARCLIGPVPFQKRANDAVMPHVWNTRNEPAARSEPQAHSLQQSFGGTQMFQDVPTDYGVERTRLEIRLHLFDITNQHLIETSSGHLRSRTNPFHPDYFDGLAGLSRLPNLPEPQPMSSTFRTVLGIRASSSGRGQSK